MCIMIERLPARRRINDAEGSINYTDQNFT